MTTEEKLLDVFGYRKNIDGTFEILKNGEHLLTCTGNERAAQNIVALLNTDGRLINGQS